MKTIILICSAALLLTPFCLSASPLTESTFTEVVNQVSTVSVSGNAAPSKVNDLLKAPDRVRTGPQSRAELTAPDKTITRVGANTIFSFSDSGRTLNLEQGNLLFHSPKGLGGGTIQSGGAAAAVLGTTLIVSATTSGGFKVILLEGTGKVTLPGGTAATLHAGQLVFVLPGGKLSPVLNINLGKLTGGSLLVKGFSKDLPSWPLVLAAIHQQETTIASGGARDTGQSPDQYLYPPANGLDVQSPGTYQQAVPQPPSANQYLNAVGTGSSAKGNGFGGFGGRGFVGTTVPLPF